MRFEFGYLSILVAILLVGMLVSGCTQQQNAPATNKTNETIVSQAQNVTTSGAKTGSVVFTVADKIAKPRENSITSVVVTIDSVQVQSAAQGWVTISSTAKSFDLLQLNASAAQSLLADANLTAGTYEQVRLSISKIMITDASGSHEAKIPSGDLKIVGQLVVDADSTSTAKLDFKADKSIHVTGAGKYIFAPVIRLETRSNATVNKANEKDVKVSGGKITEDMEVGMDENGNVGEGKSIAEDAELDIESNGNVKIVTAKKNETVTPPTPVSYSAADCTLIALEDVQSICKDSTLKISPKSGTGDSCAIDFGTTATPSSAQPVVGSWVRMEVSKKLTEDLAMNYVTLCNSPSIGGKMIGTTGCVAVMGNSATANMAKDTYLIQFKQPSTDTPYRAICNEEQITELVKLAQSR